MIVGRFLRPALRKNIVYRHDVVKETSIHDYARVPRVFGVRGMFTKFFFNLIYGCIIFDWYLVNFIAYFVTSSFLDSRKNRYRVTSLDSGKWLSIIENAIRP